MTKKKRITENKRQAESLFFFFFYLTFLLLWFREVPYCSFSHLWSRGIGGGGGDDDGDGGIGGGRPLSGPLFLSADALTCSTRDPCITFWFRLIASTTPMIFPSRNGPPSDHKTSASKLLFPLRLPSSSPSHCLYPFYRLPPLSLHSSLITRNTKQRVMIGTLCGEVKKKI